MSADRPLVTGAPTPGQSLPAGKVEEKLFSVQYKHDRQSHISITHAETCLERCGEEWGRPCTTFCPA
ncbi:MAG: hypothetical protein HY334_01785, partial [Armatimonadetes bacterium]|nr:hypothetical protein [Armatimonadota bacterium]